MTHSDDLISFTIFYSTNQCFPHAVFLPSQPLCSNTTASSSVSITTHLLSMQLVCPSIIHLHLQTRRASASSPSRDTSWGPTQHSSPRTTLTPARTQPEPPTHPLAGTTWRARVAEGASRTATRSSMALEATSVKTTETCQVSDFPRNAPQKF